MKQLFIDKSFNYINSHQKLTEYQQIKIKYGLEVMYHFITKYTTIIVLSILLNLYKELLFITLFYLPLRLFGHGIHSNSNFMCWMTSIFAMLLLSYFSRYLIVSNLFIILSVIIGLFSFALWAPSDTPSRPLINKHKRHTLKARIIITTLLYITLCFYFSKISVYIIIAIYIESFNINPFIYFINHVPRKNYVGIERS